MLTREETIKAFEHCYIAHSCKGCPLEEQGECHTVEPGVNGAVMHYLKENKPAPVTDVQEVKRGKWLKLGNDPIDNKQWICSECKGLIEKAYYCEHCYYNYCPSCGARMRGDSNDG